METIENSEKGINICESLDDNIEIAKKIFSLECDGKLTETLEFYKSLTSDVKNPYRTQAKV